MRSDEEAGWNRRSGGIISDVRKMFYDTEEWGLASAAVSLYLSSLDGVYARCSLFWTSGLARFSEKPVLDLRS